MSWRGRKISSDLGLSLHQSTYRRHLRIVHSEAIEETNQIIAAATTSVFWMDNLCKIYVTEYRIEWERAYKQVNKTAVGSYNIHSSSSLHNQLQLQQQQQQQQRTTSQVLAFYNSEIFEYQKDFSEYWLKKYQKALKREHLGK